jgi:Fe(3+) dicitrate transport protein
MRATILLIISVFLTGSTLAQTAQPTDTLRARPLSEVVVRGIRAITGVGFLTDEHDGALFTAKKTEVLLLDSLVANTAQNNPRQVLGRVPGANYSETEGSGFPSNGFGLRGLDPTQSVEMNVRQNGYNIASDLYGYPETYYLPPLEAVERIEIIRGAGALQFGPQFGGVVNYILRGPAARPLGGMASLTGGSFGFLNGFLQVGGQRGRWSYNAVVQAKRTDGWRPNSTYRQVSGFASLGYRVNAKLKLGLEYSFLQNRIQMPGGLSDEQFEANNRASIRSRNWFTSPWNVLTISADWQLSPRTSLRVQSATNASGRSLVWFPGEPDEADLIDPATGDYADREIDREKFRSNTTELRLLHRYTLGGRPQTLAAGVRTFFGWMERQEAGEGTDGSDFDLTLEEEYEAEYEFNTTNVAVFAENTFRLSERLSVVPGVRVEYLSSAIKGDAEESPGSVIVSANSRSRTLALVGIGAQYRVGAATNLYANLTQSYRPLDYSSLIPFGSLVTVDPTLKDATGFNADLGYRGSVGNFLTFDLNAFYLQYNDRIGLITRPGSGTTTVFYRTNVANSVHQGLEAYVEFSPTKLSGATGRAWNLSVFNSLALIDARYRTGEFSGKRVEYAPPVINRSGLTLTVGRLATTFLVSHTAKSYADANNTTVLPDDGVVGPIPAYTVLDWSGAYRTGRFTVKFGVNNLTDSRYFTKRTLEYPGPGIIPASGRSGYLGLSATF